MRRKMRERAEAELARSGFVQLSDFREFDDEGINEFACTVQTPDGRLCFAVRFDFSGEFIESRLWT